MHANCSGSGNDLLAKVNVVLLVVVNDNGSGKVKAWVHSAGFALPPKPSFPKLALSAQDTPDALVQPAPDRNKS